MNRIVPVLEAGTVGADPNPLSLSGSPPNGYENEPYAWAPVITGGKFPFSFSLTPSLPVASGLSFDNSTGQIYGQEPSATTYSGTLSASDSRLPNARTATLSIAFEIEESASPTLWTPDMISSDYRVAIWLGRDEAGMTRDSSGNVEEWAPYYKAGFAASGVLPQTTASNRPEYVAPGSGLPEGVGNFGTSSRRFEPGQGLESLTRNQTTILELLVCRPATGGSGTARYLSSAWTSGNVRVLGLRWDNSAEQFRVEGRRVGSDSMTTIDGGSAPPNANYFVGGEWDWATGGSNLRLFDGLNGWTSPASMTS
ncbi:MAG: hypothetical protein QW318_09180, partial [Candidatus Caldarchaeum sp.]